MNKYILSEELLNKHIEAFRNKYGKHKPKCELCGHKHFDLPKEIILLDNCFVSGSFPCLLFICENCGNTKPLNVLSLGVLDQSYFAPKKEKPTISTEPSKEPKWYDWIKDLFRGN